MTQLNIFITGGSGFIGRNLIIYLLENSNHKIFYCDNEKYSVPFEKSIANKITKVCNDISEINSEILSGIDVLIHLAAVKKHNVEDDDFTELVRTNCIETNKLFRLSCKSNVSKIIFSSSLYAHGNLFQFSAKESDYPSPNTLYGNSKLFGEGILRELSIQYKSTSFITLRLYFIYGPHQFYGKGYPSVFLNTFNRLNNNNAAIVRNDGKQKLDYLYIDDLCALIFSAIFIKPVNNFEIVNASSGNSYQIIDIINKIIEIYNPRNKDLIYDGKDFTFGTYRSGSFLKAKSIFNWEPKIGIDQGIKNFIDWYKATH